MSKLRLLYLENVNITGRYDRAFEDLRLFFWKCCPLKYLPSEFYPQKLVTLSLPCSKMKTVWELNKVSQVFEKLTTLNMPYSLELTTTPDFTKLPHLVTLNLEGCKSLEEVHISIGSLEKLVSLNLCGCVNLKSLPDTFCNLIALEVLCIANCSSLQVFFKKVGNTKFLKPGEVTRVMELDAGGAALFKKLCSSQFLNRTSISELPPNLKQIMADGCVSLKRLPNLLNLKSLEVLTLKDCNGLTEIQGVEELTSIRKLHVGGCSSSLLRNTLTEFIFQMYAGFGHQIQVYTSSAEFPDWIHQSNNLGLTVPLNLPSHNFLALILCFKQWEDKLEYRVENITNDIVWKDSVGFGDNESLIVLLPRTIFSVKDGNNNITITATAEFWGIHGLFKTELRDEYNNTDLGDEKCCPSKRLKHLYSGRK
ncbi:disease resistance-like protein CSA1 [Apium graveolens]|uniref:disease resistance-like protein CSA1 n=1 Tax=Apium graveolens TaxID=4045 RepID=UPI003D7A7A0B